MVSPTGKGVLVRKNPDCWPSHLPMVSIWTGRASGVHYATAPSQGCSAPGAFGKMRSSTMISATS